MEIIIFSNASVKTSECPILVLVLAMPRVYSQRKGHDDNENQTGEFWSQVALEAFVTDSLSSTLLLQRPLNVYFAC
jgi:hypothetical protein